jgi:protein involved in polysaccharide export with SLBB domain
MSLHSLALSLALLSVIPRAASAQDAPAAAQTASMSRSEDAAALRPGDIVRVRIWRETEMSGDFPVNEAGIAVLPKLGEVTVVGRSPTALATEIRAAYGQSIAHSSIDVLFLRRVQVIGAVRTPGLYHADPTMSVGDVLALAGGPTGNGRTNRVELYRAGHKLSGDLSSFTLVGASSIRSGDQIVVPQRSWISRNPGVAIGAVGTSLAIVRLLVFKR